MALYLGEVQESRRRTFAARVSKLMPGAAQIQLSPQQQEELDRCANSRSLAARAVERAKIGWQRARPGSNGGGDQRRYLRPSSTLLSVGSQPDLFALVGFCPPETLPL